MIDFIQGRRRTLLVSGITIFVVLVVMLLMSYVILPLFSYDSVQVPSSCMATSSLPAGFNYLIPGVGNGTLLANDSRSAVVVVVNWNSRASNSTLYLLDKNDNQTIMSMKFSNDILAATVSGGVLYLFNNKLGYMIDERNGEPVRNIIETDNYRGLYSSNNATFIQTNEEFSAINVNGSFLSHVKLSFRSIVFGCYFQ